MFEKVKDWLLASLALYSFLKGLKDFSFLLGLRSFQQQAFILRMLVRDRNAVLDLASMILLSILS